MKRTFLLPHCRWPTWVGASATLYPTAKEGGTYMHNYYLPPSPGSYPWAAGLVAGRQVDRVSRSWDRYGRWMSQTGDATQLTYDKIIIRRPIGRPTESGFSTHQMTRIAKFNCRSLTSPAANRHALTNDDHLYLDPVFSPDGSRVAYVSTHPNGHFNIYVRPIRERRVVPDLPSR